jgi:hypothetical protein
LVERYFSNDRYDRRGAVNQRMEAAEDNKKRLAQMLNPPFAIMQQGSFAEV